MLHSFIFITLFAVSSAFASDFQSPRTAGLGGAGHAAPLGNDAIYMNPAYASLIPSYSMALSILKDRGPNEDPKGRIANISVQDGRSELFQAGVGYTARPEGAFLHIGASKAVIQRLGVGIGTKFFFANDLLGKGNDGTLSVVGVPIEWLQASLTVDNLFETKTGKNWGLYREIILGTKFNLQGIALIYFDPHFIPNAPAGTFGHELGLEFQAFQDVLLRFGNFSDAMVPQARALGRGYSFGLGWLGPRIAMDYALQRVIEPRSSVAHTFGVTTYF